jgi:hypothetical protein
MNTRVKVAGLSFTAALMLASLVLTGGFVVTVPSFPTRTMARPPADDVLDKQVIAQMDELIHLHRLAAGERPDGRLGQRRALSDGR